MRRGSERARTLPNAASSTTASRIGTAHAQRARTGDGVSGGHRGGNRGRGEARDRHQRRAGAAASLEAPGTRVTLMNSQLAARRHVDATDNARRVTLSMQNHLAIVPAYNEAASIGRVVGELRKRAAEFDVLVIDDGSTDDTADRASAAGARGAAPPVQPRHRRRRPDRLPVRARAQLRHRGAGRRRRPARPRVRARAAAPPAQPPGARHGHGLALPRRRRRTATAPRRRAAWASASSPRSSPGSSASA